MTIYITRLAGMRRPVLYRGATAQLHNRFFLLKLAKYANQCHSRPVQRPNCYLHRNCLLRQLRLRQASLGHHGWYKHPPFQQPYTTRASVSGSGQQVADAGLLKRVLSGVLVWAVRLGVVAVIFLAALPSILSTKFGLRAAVRLSNAFLPGQLAIDAASVFIIHALARQKERP